MQHPVQVQPQARFCQWIIVDFLCWRLMAHWKVQVLEIGDLLTYKLYWTGDAA